MKKGVLILFFVLLILVYVKIAYSNQPPTLENIPPQVAFVGEEFTLDIKAIDEDNDQLYFIENSSLFEVKKTTAQFFPFHVQKAQITFVPVRKNIGKHTILVTVSDSVEADSKSFDLFVLEKSEGEIIIEPEVIRVVLAEGEVIENEVIFVNKGKKDLFLSVDFKNLDIEQKILKLAGKKIERLKFILIGKERGIRASHILIKGGIEKDIPIIVETESPDRLFDANLNIPPEFKAINSGDTLTFEVILFDTKHIGKTKVRVNYEIKDLGDTVIYRQSEDIFVDRRLSFVKKIKVPPYLKLGTYVLGVTTIFMGKSGTSAHLFDIKAPSEPELLKDYWLYALILLAFLMFISWSSYSYIHLKGIEKKQPAKLKEIYESFRQKKKTLEEAKIAKEKLLRQMALLRESLEKGFISKATYSTCKARIDKMLLVIKREMRYSNK